MTEPYEGNDAYNAVKPHILSLNAVVRDFQAWALAHHQSLPDGYSISTAAWHEMEAKIEDAIAVNDVTRAKQLAMEYEQRASAYLNKWRQIITNPRAAQAGQ